MTVTFIYIFFALLFIGVPVVFSLIFAPIVGFLIKEQYAFLLILPQRIFSGINQFPILAVPLFMLAGQIMTVGEITTSLVRFANSLLGHIRGGLAHVNILSSILFAGLSGSAVADTPRRATVKVAGDAVERGGRGGRGRGAARPRAARRVPGRGAPATELRVRHREDADVRGVANLAPHRRAAPDRRF